MEERKYILGQNIIENGKVFGVERRNLIETVISVGFVTILIMLIPFTKYVKVFSISVIDLVLGYINIRGIQHRSVTQIIIAEIKFRKNRRMLHLRGPEYTRKKGVYSFEEAGNESTFESWTRAVKEFIAKFIERYGSDQDS